MPDFELAFLDTETSGLDPLVHRVVEVAAERFTPWPEMASKGRFEFKVLLSDADFKNASPKALEVNGYTPASWTDAFDPDDDQPWIALAEFLHHAVIVGQNVPFDTGFVQEELRRRSLLMGAPPWQRRLVDVQSYCHILAEEYNVQKNGEHSWGLNETYKAIGGPPLVEHRAGPDIDKAVFIYKLARERFKHASLLPSMIVSDINTPADYYTKLGVV